MATSFDTRHFRNLLASWPEMAIVLLYENFYEKLLRIADIHTRDRQSSEDVLQEVFSDIFKRHKEIGEQKSGSIQTYLIKAVQFHSITHYKRRVTNSARETQYYYSQTDSGDAYSPDSHIISCEQSRFLRLVVCMLPPRQKACMSMQLEGMRVKEIASRLSISTKAVERNLTIARKRLRAFNCVEV